METKNASHQNNPHAVAARKGRNMWLGLALLGFVVLMGVGTALRISQGAGTKPGQSLYWNMTPGDSGAQDMPDLPEPADVEPG